MDMTHSHGVHPDVPRALRRVFVNGTAADVLAGDQADFVCMTWPTAVEVEVAAPADTGSPTIRPRARGIVPAATARGIRFTLSTPLHAALEWPEQKPLLIFADSPAPDADRPAPGAPGVRVFRILGPGVLDGGGRSLGGARHPAILIERCRDVRVRDLVLVRPAGWTVVPALSARVAIERVKVVSSGAGADGIDVCASLDVRIADCMLCTGDDGVAVTNVHFERIRIDHCYDRLLDFRIMRSRYSRDAERGSVRGVTLRDIDWTTTPFNAGYTYALIGGYDDAHRVEDVAIAAFRIDGRRIDHLDARDLHTRHARGIRLV